MVALNTAIASSGRVVIGMAQYIAIAWRSRTKR
jgi:hypothetical protein